MEGTLGYGGYIGVHWGYIGVHCLDTHSEILTGFFLIEMGIPKSPTTP